MKRITPLILPVCFLFTVIACSEDDPVGPVGSSLQLVPEAHAEVLPGRVQFSWSAAPGATSYRLQVGHRVEDSILPDDDTLLSATSCDLYVDLDRIGEEMAWRVQPVGADGMAGTWSEYSPFTVRRFMQHPANRVILKAGRVTLTWEPLPGATGYEVQVGRANGNIFFTELDTTVVASDCAFNLNGPWVAGTVAWRMRPVCPGSDMKAWSDPALFSLDGWDAARLYMENLLLQYRTVRGSGDPLLRYPQYEVITLTKPDISGNRWTFTTAKPLSLEHILNGLNGTDNFSLIVEFSDAMDRIVDAELVLDGTGYAPVSGIGGEGRYARDLRLRLRDIPRDGAGQDRYVLTGDDVAAHTESFSDSILVYAGYWEIDPIGMGGGQRWISLANELFVLDALQVSASTRVRIEFE